MLEEAFREFDTDQSGDICQKELRNILRSLGHNPSEGEVNELMAKVCPIIRKEKI